MGRETIYAANPEQGYINITIGSDDLFINIEQAYAIHAALGEAVAEYEGGAHDRPRTLAGARQTYRRRLITTRQRNRARRHAGSRYRAVRGQSAIRYRLY
ncbi:hypothetical protein [Neisseria gonorrhoeae]|uniref:hypothetical protein n=1 Tax=Neisseria gonorrhoeae TaxID=485 RepID=UPI00223EDC9A|nr:hypothetical protein [Neisseria gonorrhoeae]UYP52481.1 hypothetical protein ND436_002870 [Neisseria gonorrhoeae]